MIGDGVALSAVAALAAEGRIEEAAKLAPRVDDTAGLADLVSDVPGRAEFRDVDITLVRLIEDVLDRLPANDRVRRARLAAKLAFELRGDAASLDRRRTLLAGAKRDASASEDPRALIAVLIAQINALWEPAGGPDRLAAADRAIETARRIHDLDSEMQARVARIDVLVHLGRVAEGEFELSTYARLAKTLDRPHFDTFVASRRAMFAMLHGRIDDIARYGEQAWANAVRAGMPDAYRLGMLYRGSVARERSGPEYDGVLESGAAMLREQAARMPGQYFEADVAGFLLYCGRPDEARAELARAMPSLLTTYDYRWHLAAANAAEVAAAVGHVSDCERLYVKLLPHADVFVAMGPAFWGSTRHRLGLLAHRMDRVDEALDHLRRAVDELDAVAALSWAARARVDLARALRATGDREAAAREENDARQAMQTLGMTRPLAALEAASGSADAVAWSLTRDGTDWLLTAGAEHARFRGGRGFEHLAVLLAHPGQDIAARDLDAGPDAPAVAGGLEVLDEQALVAYRRRLAEIDDELDGADRRGDAESAARLATERDHLVAELRGATGLAGRTRRTHDGAERARVNATRNLKRAIEQISRAAPIAGAHLSASIRTGSACRYEPAPGGPPRWQV